MPFAQVSKTMAARRQARRRPRGLAEIQAIQSQYQEDVMGAQSRLTGAQTAATQEFSDLSSQYESQLTSYQDELTNYNKRADQFASRVDSYIGTLDEIKRVKDQNMINLYVNWTGLARMFGGEDRPMEQVPATPADPGSFTESFDRPVPKAPQAPSFQEDVSRFQKETQEAKVGMEREIGERRAATQRARFRMRDRPLMTGA